MQFINPACAENDDYPAFIACPLSRIVEIWKSLNGHERIKVERVFNTIDDEYHVVNGKKESNYYRWITWDENGQNYDNNCHQNGARFGASMVAVDLNGDNYDDLIVGAPLFSDIEVGCNNFKDYLF